MGKTAKELVAIAAAQIGYCEKASNSNLDSNSGNAGSANYTKYARDLNNAGYYNGNKNGYAWCDVFCDWCFYQLCGKSKSAAEAMECQTGELGAGCYYSKQYYKNQGRLYATPQVGDQAFFKQNGDVCHTGIVAEVDGNKYITIEGNYQNKVSKVTHYVGDGYTDSFGRPKYDGSVSSSSISVELEKGDCNASVKELQEKLIKLGYSCGGAGADGDFGEATDSAVRKFQKDYGLDVDGVVGQMTWASLNAAVSGVAKATASSSDGEEPGSASSTTVSGTASTGTKADAKSIWDYLISKIGNAYGAAALMGNLYAESGLISNNLENYYNSSLGYTDKQYTDAVDSGTYTKFVKDAAGYGLAQWTYYTRKQALLDYAKKCGKSICDLDMQLDFLYNELKISYPSVLSALTSAKTIRDASDVVLVKFENPAVQTEAVKEKRASYGKDYYDSFYGRIEDQESSSHTAAATKQSNEYNVKVLVRSLAVRQKPMSSAGIVKYIRDRGIYTIVKESNKWGLLKDYKSGEDGWIQLTYTKKV